MVDEIDQGRRAFFRHAAGKAAEHIVEEARSRIESRARRWVRPPYALAELEFILACTRCGDCVTACQYKVIFPLPASYGADVAATAALDVLNGGCHLCADWPCVSACEAGALKRPIVGHDEQGDVFQAWPKMANATILTDECLPYRGPECGACDGICPVPGALTFSLERPTINNDYCTGCGMCRAACIADPVAIQVSSKYSNNDI